MFSYHVVWPTRSGDQRKVSLFKNWLVKRVGEALQADLF
jgi:hypothetical protein